MPEPSYAWLRANLELEHLRGGLRGLERETLRVDCDGRIATTPHPASLGSALTHPFLTTDYSEALLEFVTPPFGSNAETLRNLTELHAFVQRRLDGELMWPASMPCIESSDDAVPIARYGPSNEGRFRTVYRRGLGYRYGRAMQAIAGVHFNYSPPQKLWPAWHDAAGTAVSLRQFRSEALMSLVRNYRRLAWVLAYLFGASPAIARSFLPDGHDRLVAHGSDTWYAQYATSLRMSDLGYRNSTQSRLGISVNSLADYVGELRAAISTVDPHYESIGVQVDGEYRQLSPCVLQIENEYYSSIRPKPASKSLRAVDALENEGVEYVEVRTLDSDPESIVGIGDAQMRVAELLLLHCLFSASPPIETAEQAEIDRRELVVAWEGRRPGITVERNGAAVPLAEWGNELADQLEPIADILGRDEYGGAVESVRLGFSEPERLPSAMLLDALGGGVSLLEYGLEAARRHARELLDFDIGQARIEALDSVAAASLESAERMARADRVPFARYLAEYLGGDGAGIGSSNL